MAKRSSSSGYLVDHKEASERPKPTVRVTDKNLPAIKDWGVGKKYKVHATVKMRHHAEGQEYSYGDERDSKEHSATLEIHSIKPVDDEKEKK